MELYHLQTIYFHKPVTYEDMQLCLVPLTVLLSSFSTGKQSVSTSSLSQEKCWRKKNGLFSSKCFNNLSMTLPSLLLNRICMMTIGQFKLNHSHELFSPREGNKWEYKWLDLNSIHNSFEGQTKKIPYHKWTISSII